VADANEGAAADDNEGLNPPMNGVGNGQALTGLNQAQGNKGNKP